MSVANFEKPNPNWLKQKKKKKDLLPCVTERPGVALASGMVGSRENSVTRIHPSSLLWQGMGGVGATLQQPFPSQYQGICQGYQGYILAGPIQGERENPSSLSHPTNVLVFPHWSNSSAV